MLCKAVPVALRKESVDRNILIPPLHTPCFVALRKESVDRNFVFRRIASLEHVALRKESVDRNARTFATYDHSGFWSLSARRAWIEICRTLSQRDSAPPVALRKESVDRNFGVFAIAVGFLVALRKESVDRNINCVDEYITFCKGRSPQGERG